MSRRSLDVQRLRQHPQYRQPHLLDGGAGLRGVPNAPHLVEDHPRHAHAGIEPRHPQRHRADAARRVSGVDHQHHRRVQQPSYVRRRPEPAGAEASVEQPHHALDHRDIRTRGAVREQRSHPLLAA